MAPLFFTKKNKIMINTAYWISPKGEIIPVSGPSGSCHIQAVINNPQTFGLDLDYIKDVYDKHNEELGSEGKAREEIILGLSGLTYYKGLCYEKFQRIN